MNARQTMHVRAVDLFCGAGGSSWGAQAAGAQIVAGVDMWGLAGSVFKDNFPHARFHESRLEDLKPKSLARELGAIDLLLASPECTNHSAAKGNRPRCEESRETAFQVIRFAEALGPRWIVVENVVSMRLWARYREFLGALAVLGYHATEHVLNAADFGVPQNRRRLFIVLDRERKPDAIQPPKSRARTALDVVDQNGRYTYSPLDTPSRARATLDRANRAVAALGDGASFLVVYYGSDGAGGWQPLHVPLRTITTLDRFAYVKPTREGHVMRMLQPPELQRAMGMPQRFKIAHGSRRDRIHLIGNAVCPPVMQHIVQALIRKG